MQGTADRELHGSARGARHRQLLEAAEAKMREAMRRERDAEDNERLVSHRNQLKSFKVTS